MYYESKLSVNTRQTCAITKGWMSRNFRLQINANIFDQPETASYIEVVPLINI